MTNDLPERLRKLAASMPIPATLTTAGLRERLGDPDSLDPAPGQVRRAVWEHVSLLVLLIAADGGRRWQVAPVSVEPTGEDEYSLVVSAERTTFPVEVTAWAGLTTAIPTGALGRVVDVWEPDLMAWCAAAATGAPGEAPVGARRGVPADVYDSSGAVRARLADDLEALTQAPLVPVQGTASVDLRAEVARIGLQAVKDALGLSQAQVMKIAGGRRPVTESEAGLLAGLFGRTAEEILAAVGGLPADLAAELEQPRRRPTWRRMANRLGVSEAAARWAAGTGTLALAYRQTGGTAPAWRSRLDRWLAANGYETGLGDDA